MPPPLALTVTTSSLVALSTPEGTPLYATPLPLGTGVSSFITVATAAALTALSTAGLTAGTPAYIVGRTTLWAYQPADPGPADGWHIAASGGGFWVYTGAGEGPSQANSTLWVIDPVAGSDDNTGHTVGSPLQHFAEVVRRCGGFEPTITTATQVNIHFLSSQTTDSDPVIFRPNMAGGATILYDAPLPAPSFTGSIATLTAKVNNVAPGNGLQVTFTTTTGAMAAGLLLVNNTKGTRAFAQRNVSGGTWQLTQPQSNWPGGAIGPSEDNTWAATDSISGYSLIAVAITDVSAVQAPGVFANFVNLNQLTVLDKSGFGLDPMFANFALFQAIDCAVQRNVFSQSADGFFFQNVYYTGVSATGSGGTVYGGFWGSQSIFTGILWRNDAILRHSPVIIVNNIGQEFENPTLIDAGCTIRYDVGNLDEETFPATGNVYGGGVFNNLGRVYYSPGTAVATFLCTIQLNGLTTGYSEVTTGGVGSGGATTRHNLALTAANLDAAAGAAGFGGNAEGGGALFTNGTQN